MSGPGDHMFTFENRSFRLITILALFAALIAILVVFRAVLLPFVFAIVVAYVMEPLVRRINQRPIYGFVIPRWTAVILLYISFFAVLAGLVIFLVPPMYRELRASIETEWPKTKAQIEAYLAEPPPPTDPKDGPAPAAADAKPVEGDAPADPIPTRDQLRLTDVDGEVIWVPRRLGPATINVYPNESIDPYLEFLEARRAEGASSSPPPSPAYALKVHVVPGWSIESPNLEKTAPEPKEEVTIARLGQRTELRFRHLGHRPTEALVEIVYPAAEGQPELRDYRGREVPTDHPDPGAKKATKSPDLLALAKDFGRKQSRNAFSWVSKEAEARLQKSVEYVAPVVGAVFKSVFTIFLVLMLAAFISSDLRGIQRFFFELVPPSYRPQFEELMSGLDRGLSGVIRGQLLICLINGTLTGVGLYSMDVPFWHVLTLVVTVLTLIPIFGTILSSIPCVLFALTEGGLTTGVMVLGWILAIHALEAYVLNPKIMGHSAHIHPVLVVFGLVAGEQTYGLIGALLAVPFVSILQNIFIFVHKRLVAATEEEAQRTGLHFRKKPKVMEEEEELRRRAREEAAKKREKSDREEVKAERRDA